MLAYPENQEDGGSRSPRTKWEETICWQISEVGFESTKLLDCPDSYRKARCGCYYGHGRCQGSQAFDI